MKPRMTADLGEQLVVGARLRRGVAEQVGEQLLGEVVVIGTWLRLAYAVTRISAPSSSRMLVVMCVAMNSSVSAGTWTAIALGLVAQDGQAGLQVGRLDVGDQAPLEPAAQAFLERRDGVGHAVGLEITICLLAPCSELKVWKNSSWRPSLPSMNWMSSISSTSMSR